MADELDPLKQTFLQDCLSAKALQFGTFTLKSKRVSPYFFNAGVFHRADLLRSISTAYSKTLCSYAQRSNGCFEFDVLFGPAYKGIPLATSVVARLADLDSGRYSSLSLSFNRKESKDHGERGNIIGSPLKGKKVVIVDDVITAGTAMREAVDIIAAEGGQVVGVIVAFDRMERVPTSAGEDAKGGGSRKSVIGQFQSEYGIPVLAVLTLDDVLCYLRALGTVEDLKRLEEYRAQYMAID